MKKLLPFLLLFVIALQLKAQNNNWSWTRVSTGNANGEGWAVCTDGNDNIFITGFYQNDTITFGNITLPSPGSSRNAYIVKYDVWGNVVWAKSSTSANAYAYSVTVDGAGNSFITGCFYGATIHFGSFTLTNADNTGNSSDLFVVKYDPMGNVIWARSVAAMGDDVGNGICADAAGNVFVTGNFRSLSITLGTTTLTNADNSGMTHDVFVAKYDAAGNPLWAKSGNGITTDNSSAVSTDGGGNAYITGYYYSDTIIFSSDTLVNVTNNSTRADIFMLKYDAAGNLLWSKTIGGSGNDLGYSVSTAPAGNVFFTGGFYSSSLSFGSNTITNSSESAYVTKYDANGNALWARASVSSNHVFGYSISADVSGNAYATGGYTGTQVTFGSITLNVPAGNCSPYLCDPMYIVRYDANGNAICGSTLLNGSDDLHGVAADNVGNAYFVSDFFAHPFVVGNDTLNPSAVEDVFLSKFSCSALDVQNNSISSSVRIFPNPSNGKFTLENNDVQNGEQVLKIYNTLGEVVFQSTISQQKTEIDLSNLPKGIYFFQLISKEQKTINGKITLQ